MADKKREGRAGDFTGDTTFDDLMGPGSSEARNMALDRARMLGRKWFRDPDTGRMVQEADFALGVPGRMPGEGLAALVRRMRLEVLNKPQPEPEQTPIDAKMMPWFDPAMREQIFSPSTGQNLADSIHWIMARLRGEPL